MVQSKIHAALPVALCAAIEAGDYFASRIQTELIVKTKTTFSDLVTDVDPKCEDMIRKRILATFPDHAMLGEESTAPGADAAVQAVEGIAQTANVWIVDPLDGTTNFVSGLPLSVVSIAYAEAGELKVGVIYDPYRQEIFYAEQNCGSFLSNRDEVLSWLSESEELPVRRVGLNLSTSKQTEKERSLFASGYPGRVVNRAVHLQRVLGFAENVKGFRMLGAAALHMAYVASGRLEGYFEYNLNAWDLAAGALMITEAGGYVRDMETGQKYSLLVRNIMAAGNMSILEQIQDTFVTKGE